MALPLVVPIAAGAVVLATGGTGAVSTLLTYKIKEHNAKKKIEAEILESKHIIVDSNTSPATSWRTKGDFFVEKARFEEDDATSFLQINRYQKALECYNQGLDEAKMCFDHIETAKLLKAIAIAKWKETHALKIFTKIAGPIFKTRILRFQQNFQDAIQSFVKAELLGRDVMNSDWLQHTREIYEKCLEDLTSTMTKIALMTYSEWMEYMFSTLEFMAQFDPYKCEVYYKIVKLQSEERDFDGAFKTLEKCKVLIEEFSHSGPASPYMVVASDMYAKLMKEILEVAHTAEEEGYSESNVTILEQCERLVHDIETKHTDQSDDFEELKEKVTNQLGKYMMAMIGTLKSKLLSKQKIVITVKRSSIFQQALHMYKDPDFIKYQLYVQFEGEEGEDGGGLTKEFFTLFWDECFERYFIGDEVKVPKIIPDQTEECSKIMMVVGRILTHQLMLTDKIPECISPIFLATVFMPEVRAIKDEKLIASCISREMLLSNILLYVRPEERALLKKVISGELITEDIEDALIDLYDRIGMQCLPREDSICDQIVQMAQSELVVKPKYFAEAIFKGVPDKACQIFWNRITPEQYQALHDSLAPTPLKVANALSFYMEEPDERELQIMAWLEEIVKEMTSAEAKAFVRYVTGLSTMPDVLVVAFNGTTRWEKVPRAHTCGNLLEISVEYRSKEEMRDVLINVISTEQAFVMSSA